MSAPFRYSGQPSYRRDEAPAYLDFQRATGIDLGHSCGIDCDYHKDGWRGVSPTVEIVRADFTEARAARAAGQSDMFARAAE